MRVFVLGVDGLTFRILDPLIEKGYLPHFTQLKQEGAWGILKSTIPPITPAAWMSIATGLKPARHGALDFVDVEWAEDQIRLSLVTRRRSGRAIWEILSDYQRRVAVANVPCTYPPDAVNGFMVSGFSAPGPLSPFTYPPALRDELFRAIPDYQIDIVRHDQSETYSENELLTLVRRMTQSRIQLLDFILESEPWDFVFFTFVGADRLQHELWSQLIAGESQKLVEYYRTLDNVLSKVMDWIADDGVLLIVSDHGFRGTNRVCYVNHLLCERGLLKLRSSARLKTMLVPLIKRLRLMALAELLYTRLVRQGNQVGALTPSRLLGPTAVEGSRMWALAYARSIYTAVFCRPSLLTDGADNLIAHLVRELRDRSIISDEVYTGEALRQALGLRDETWGPQAILIANDPWAFQGKPDAGRVTEATQTVGVHDMDGSLLAWGRGVKPGRLAQPVSVFDIAPTILYAFDLPVESDLDGRVLTDLFTFQRQLRMRDSMTGAIWTEGQPSDRVRRKLDRLMGEGA